jgi:LysR family positive regulator for ilvC
MAIDIKALELFDHLASSLHFAKTAQAKYVSASTLSRAIMRIEEQVGCQLFIRDNRSVVLTEAGVKFHLFAKEQLRNWHNLQNELRHQDQLTGTLTIYCSVTAAYSHLPALLDKFRHQHPQVDIMLTTGDANKAPKEVLNGQADVAIAAYPEQLASSLHFYHLADIPLAMIAPNTECAISEVLAHREQSTDIDWQNLPIILPEHGPVRKRFDRWYKGKHLGKAHIYAQVSGHEALVSMVALGCGVGCAPTVVIENSPVKERVEILTEENEFEPLRLGLCCLKSRLDSPLIAAFIQASEQTS